MVGENQSSKSKMQNYIAKCKKKFTDVNGWELLK